MPGRTLDIEDFFEVEDDGRFVDRIFHFCDQRCERCAFTDRCRQYAEQQRLAREHPGDNWRQQATRSFTVTADMLKRWCAREGVDYETISNESRTSEAVSAEMKRIQDARRDPLQQVAEAYTFPAMKLAGVLKAAAECAGWPAEARDALETIEWFGIRVSSKVHRAIIGHARRAEAAFDDEDRVQSDWNGSAKMARLAIAESRAAWETIVRVGESPGDSPLRRMVGLLDELDAAVAERFPDAMAFVRPGFDASADAGPRLDRLIPIPNPNP